MLFAFCQKGCTIVQLCQTMVTYVVLFWEFLVQSETFPEKCLNSVERVLCVFFFFFNNCPTKNTKVPWDGTNCSLKIRILWIEIKLQVWNFKLKKNKKVNILIFGSFTFFFFANIAIQYHLCILTMQ